MILTLLQPQYKTRINVRPVKHAYFVREDDVENLTRVMRYVCTQWGGIGHLIVPVKPDLSIAPFFERYLKHHEPDIFIGFLRGSKERDYEDHWEVQRYLSRVFPHRMISLEIDDIFIEHDRAMHPLGAVPPEQLRGNRLISHQFFGPEEDRWLLLALFGTIYEGQYEDYANEAQLENTGVVVGNTAFWHAQCANSPFTSILNLTGYGIAPYFAEGGSESNTFDVVLVNSVNSLCMYWALRASREAEQFHKESGRRTILLPERLLADNEALKEMVSMIRSKLPHRYLSSNLHIRFCVGDEADRERLSAVVSELKGIEKFTEERAVIHMGTGAESEAEQARTDESLKYAFTVPRFSPQFKEGVGRQVPLNTELRFGNNEIFFNPPEGFTNRNGQVTALDIECEVWQRYPKDHLTAQRILDNGWFSRYGFTYLAHTPDRTTYLHFNLPDEWETVSHHFGARGYEARRSKDGIYADSIVNLVGGIEQIDEVATKPAYLLLDALALKSTKKIAQRITGQFNLPEGSAADIQQLLTEIEVVPELKRVPKTLRQLSDGIMRPYRQGLLNLLTRLSEKQLIKRGLHLPCPSCGTPSWYPLQTIQETVTCSGCSSEFPLPVEHPRGNEIQWEYTLNTLVNRVMDQDALPAVLVLRHLTKSQQACCLIPGLELLQAGSVQAELDFLFIQNQQLIAGECKAGKEIGDKDVETARLAAQLGVSRFYYCTISRFSESSQQRIEELKREYESTTPRMVISSLSGDDLLGEAIA